MKLCDTEKTKMIYTQVLTSWLLSVLVALSPLDKRVEPRDREDSYTKELRLESISRDIVSVVYDDDEKPLFAGPGGLEKSAIFVATWASHESGGFAKTVDEGSRKGDHGSSWCIMQLHIGAGKTAEGWTGKDVIEDRRKCIRAGYRVMKQAWNRCPGDPSERMAAYISGNCRVARSAARFRYAHAMKLFKKNSFKAFMDDYEADLKDFTALQP